MTDRKLFKYNVKLNVSSAEAQNYSGAGALVASVVVLKIGKYRYDYIEGSQLEEIIETEMARAETQASAKALPLTIEHPDNMIQLTNWHEEAVGICTEPAVVDGSMKMNVAITCPATIADVLAGDWPEVSAGYWADVGADLVQRNIVFNHIALVKKGRLGRDVSIKLNSDHDNIIKGTMFKTNNDDVTQAEDEAAHVCEDDCAEHKQNSQLASLAEMFNMSAESFASKVEEHKTQLTALFAAEEEVVNEEVVNEEEEEDKEAKMNAYVDKKVELLLLANKHNIDVDTRSSIKELQLQLVSALKPTLKVDDKPPPYLDALIDDIKTINIVAKPASKPTETKLNGGYQIISREEMIRRSQNK